MTQNYGGQQEPKTIQLPNGVSLRKTAAGMETMQITNKVQKRDCGADGKNVLQGMKNLYRSIKYYASSEAMQKTTDTKQ